MTKYCSLSQIPVNKSHTIAHIDEKNSMRRRLWDLGFTKGASIEAVYVSPSGNPRAYLIRGCIIALRNEDAATIHLNSL